MASTLYHRINFTKSVDQALVSTADIQGQLKGVLAVVNTQRRFAIKALRSKLSKSHRKMLCVLMTLFKEQLDVLGDLLCSAKPRDVWANECRFYSQPDGTTVCRCGADEINVEDHFPSRQMLVVTPLTRECRRAYFQAYVSGAVLCFYGPAGTGKTETVKDTAAMLGRDAVVLNCTREWNMSKAMAELTALRSSESDSSSIVFDCFDRLADDVQRACLDAVARAGRLVSLTGNKPPSEALSRTHKFVTLPMTVPCYAAIAQVMLGCEGLVDCDALGLAMHSCLQECQSTCSKQSWYDFGLRTYRECVKLSAVSARNTSYADETASLCDTLAAKLFSMATAADKPRVLTIVKKAFGRTPVLPPSWSGKSGLSSMVQSMQIVRHGVCVVGLSEADADACITSAVEAMGVESIVIRHTSESESLNSCKHALAAAMKVGSESNKEMRIFLKVFQTGGDPLTSLHSLLDDNRKLCLDNGEVVLLARNVRMIVITDNCSSWSPATVCRLGMICGEMSLPSIDWKTKCEEAEARCIELETKLQSIQEVISNLMSGV